MSEGILVADIRWRFSKGDTRLFRNNVGVLEDANGNHVRYGLCVGSSDLIGWRSVVIMPKDVGNELAVFCAIEAKSARGKLTGPQAQFLATVKDAGGFAGVARSIEDARDILTR
jgi:hypothetical protein